jgi:hypothetical protein
MTPIERIEDWLAARQYLDRPPDGVHQINGRHTLYASDVRELVEGFRAAEKLLHASGWRTTESSGS